MINCHSYWWKYVSMQNGYERKPKENKLVRRHVAAELMLLAESVRVRARV